MMFLMDSTDSTDDASLATVGHPSSIVESEEPAMTSEPQPSFEANTSASPQFRSEPAPPLIEEAEEVLSEEEQKLEKGNQNFLKLVRKIRGRIRQDKDLLLVCTGERGIGKSVSMHKIAMAVNPKFDMRVNTLFDPEVGKLKDIIYGLPKYSAIVIDELIRVGYRRNWAAEGNKHLNEVFNLCRNQNQAVLACIPNFTDIDSGVQKNVTLWVHIVERGTAVAFYGDQNPFVSDRWHLRENEKFIQAACKGVPMHFWSRYDKLRHLHELPNFFTWFTFPDFTPEEKALYTSLKIPFDLYRENEPGKVLANKAARVRIDKAENALSGALLELYAAGLSVGRLEEVTGLPRQKIGKVLRDGQGKSLQDLKKEYVRK